MPPQEPKSVSIPLSDIRTAGSGAPPDQERVDKITQFDINASIGEMRSLLLEVRDLLTNPKVVRAAYSVEEVAATLGKSTYTVREWCRLGRIHAAKRCEKRGGAELWSIPAAEVTRIRDEGLLALSSVSQRAGWRHTGPKAQSWSAFLGLN